MTQSKKSKLAGAVTISLLASMTPAQAEEAKEQIVDQLKGMGLNVNSDYQLEAGADTKTSLKSLLSYAEEKGLTITVEPSSTDDGEPSFRLTKPSGINLLQSTNVFQRGPGSRIRQD